MTSIIIVNYNSYQDTLDCVQSILESVCTELFEIIVVDNASANDSWEKLHVLSGKAVLLRAEENKGYCAGNNIGIRYALERKADFIWILNPDTLIEKDTLQNLNTFAQGKKDMGILGCKLVYYPDTQYLQGFGGSDISIQKNGLMAPGKHIYHLQSSDTALPDAVSLDVIIGASMYIPRKVFETCGLMDERFHLYEDETEFCLRAAKFGFRHYAISSATVYHKEGWRKPGQKREAVYYTARNLLMLTKMHFPKYLARNVFFTFFSRRFISLVIHRRFDEARLICKGVRDFFSGIEGKADLSKYTGARK